MQQCSKELGGMSSNMLSSMEKRSKKIDGKNSKMILNAEMQTADLRKQRDQYLITKKLMEENFAERKIVLDQKVDELEWEYYFGLVMCYVPLIMKTIDAYPEELKKRKDFEQKFSKDMKKVDDQIKMLDEKIENLKQKFSKDMKKVDDQIKML